MSDYSRVLNANAIAYGLEDLPGTILAEHFIQGGANLLSQLIEEGDVIFTPNTATTDFSVDLSPSLSDRLTVDLAPHYAMQICFPELYKELFGGSLLLDADIWDAGDHPALMWLAVQAQNALDNEGAEQYYVPEPEPEPSNAYNDWIAECKAYQDEVSRLYDNYLTVCHLRKERIKEGQEWRAAEIQRINSSYHLGLDALKENVEDARNAHLALKAQGKPARPKKES